MANLWEDLRRQARQIENEVDLKLVSFSKLGTTYSSHKEYESDTAPLLNKASSEHMFDTMAMEISQLLSKLTEINGRMVEYIQNTSSSSPSSALLHTLQRHRDILQDYSHEFQKITTNITAMKDREDLLGSVRRDISSYKNSGLNRRSDLYLKEHDHIRNSERLVDEQINIAIATKENLQSQGRFLTSVTHKMNTFVNRFPVVNSLVQRIHFRRRRDSIIISIVIAICIILLLLYSFH
uniref:Golgi SNAP receptor complex member 1 n=1 Tax=Arion vulgaris TaxID=1028688 RepID=A0A0B7BTX1_9EUPU